MPATRAATSGNGIAGRGDRPQSMQHVIHRRRDQGRTEPCCSESRLRSNDRDDLVDAQVRARERMSPPAVCLDIPERRCDPIIDAGRPTQVRRPLERRRSGRRSTSSSSQCELRKSRATTLNGIPLDRRRAQDSRPRRVQPGSTGVPLADAAVMNSRKRGWALVGFDLNSG